MKRFDSINMVPFIDIMLVLLAIVLTTATFVSQGKLDIALPKAENHNDASEIEGIDLAIDKHAQLFCNTEAVTLEQLPATLNALRPLNQVTLRVDKQVPFERFVAVVDILKTYPIDALSILTESGP